MHWETKKITRLALLQYALYLGGDVSSLPVRGITKQQQERQVWGYCED